MADSVLAVYYKTLRPGDFFQWRGGDMIKTKGMALMGRFGDLPHSGAGSSFNCICIETGEPYHVMVMSWLSLLKRSRGTTHAIQQVQP